MEQGAMEQGAWLAPNLRDPVWILSAEHPKMTASSSSKLKPLALVPPIAGSALPSVSNLWKLSASFSLLEASMPKVSSGNIQSTTYLPFPRGGVSSRGRVSAWNREEREYVADSQCGVSVWGRGPCGKVRGPYG